MRILQLLDYADPENLGGASRVALELARALGELGHRSVVFAGCKGRRGTAGARNYKLCFFPSPPSEERTFTSSVRLFQEPRRVFYRHLRSKPDLLLSHQGFVWWSLREELRGLPSLYYFHSPWPEEYWIRHRRGGPGRLLNLGLRVLLERWALKKARRILLSSRFMTRRLCLWHGERFLQKILVLTYGVDTEFFTLHGEKPALRRLLQLPQNRTILITVRRLEARMGLGNLLAAFAHLRRRHRGLYLVVVGQGRLREELESQAAALRISEDVRFWGYAPDEELPRLYGACDLFVLPTEKLEGFGLVVLEASACGLPVVATPVGGIPEALSPITPHFLALDTSEPALREAMERALSAAPFEGAALRASVLKHYCWKKTARRFSAIAQAAFSEEDLSVSVP